MYIVEQEEVYMNTSVNIGVISGFILGLMVYIIVWESVM